MSTVENNNKIFRCDKCNKSYKDKSGLWYHNNKYHSINSLENPEVSLKNPENNLKNPKKTLNISCEYCNKIFSRKDNLKVHLKTCKKRADKIVYLENIVKQQYEENKKQSEEIKEVKSLLMDLINKKCIVNPKTLQKITGNNNSINSGNVNNIQIVKFGSEDIKSILSDKEIKKILNCKYKAIEESIKTVHFNDDRPEYRNIYITNLRDNIAYVYNGNKFEAVQKHSVINQLIDQHMNNIEVSYDDYKNKLPEKTVSILDKLIEKIQDDHTAMIDEENNKEFKSYKLFKINEVKLMIYNETGNNTEVIKLKYNGSMLNKNKEIEV